MNTIIRDLFSMGDSKYKEFSSRLIPEIDGDRVIGVRIPLLRDYAKKMSEQSIDEFLGELPHYYHEENCLHGYIIGKEKKDVGKVFERLDVFLPYVDNWAVCDTISPKIFKKHPKQTLERIKIWIKDAAHPYTVRFAIVTLLGYYLDENFDVSHLETVAATQCGEYYVNMAVAWYFSFALIKQYESAVKFIESGRLDKWVHNKSIQKALESFRIDDACKQYLKTLKRK